MSNNQRKMRLRVVSRKGGVSKSTISFNMRKDLGMKYITNDKENSPIHSLFPEMYFQVPELEMSFEEYVNRVVSTKSTEEEKRKIQTSYYTNKDTVEKQRGLKIVEKTRMFDTILDLGGFPDKKSQEFIIKSDLVIVPTINDINSLYSNTRFIKRLEKVNSNILIVVSLCKKNDLEERTKIFRDQGIDYPILPLSESDRIKKCIRSKKSICEYFEDTSFKLSKHIYKKIYNEYQDILTVVRNRYQEIQNNQ